MKVTVILFAAAVVLLTACAISLWRGRTIGLYGIIEPRSSVFYWLIVLTYGVLGGLSLTFAIRSLWR